MIRWSLLLSSGIIFSVPVFANLVHQEEQIQEATLSIRNNDNESENIEVDQGIKGLIDDVINEEIDDVINEVTNEKPTAAQQITINNKEFIKKNNLSRIENLEPTVENKNKSLILKNINNQFILDLNDDQTLVVDTQAQEQGEKEKKSEETEPQDTDNDQEKSRITKATDITEVQKYGGFKGYQQSLLNQVLSDKVTTQSLDETLGNLKIQELTQQYSKLNKQYIDVISKKQLNDETYRQLLLSTRLTENAIKETIASINARSIKINLLDQKLEQTKNQLEENLPILVQAEENLVRYTQTFYKMNHDLFDLNNKVSEIKLFGKSNNIAETLASDIIVKDLTLWLEQLLEEVSNQRRTFNLLYARVIREQDQLSGELDQQEFEKDLLSQQIKNYEEFFLYVKSNKAYIDNKKIELEEEKILLWETDNDLLILLNKVDSPEQLEIIKEKLQTKVVNEEKYFDFPMPEVKKITSFFEDDHYNHLFWVDHHYALDFRSAQWSDIFAPADGFVYKVINQNSSMLNRFILLHQNNFATVYLHMQDTFVQEGEYVSKGDLLWLSGGTPGTRGAGHMTTGPHLHREVWKDAKVVDPLLYTDLSIIPNKDMLQERHWEKRERDVKE